MQMQVCTKGVGFAVALTACVGLTGTAFAGGGDLPGTGPTITGGQLTATPAGVLITGDTSDNTDFFDVGPLTMPPTDCGASTAPDAWWTISIGTATGTLAVDIDLCEDEMGNFIGLTTYDSKIFVLDGGGTPIQCNDETGCGDATTPTASAILNLQLAPGGYDLAIDGFGTASGPYGGQVRLFQPNQCFLDPPCTGPTEGEVCDEVNPDNFNGGCNSTPEAFSIAAIDLAVCGVNWGNNGTRDTDWWSFNNTVLKAYELRVRAETDTVVFLAQMTAGGTCPVVGIPDGVPAFSGDCDAENILGEGYVLDPGDYIMFVGTGNAAGGGVFDGFPCPDGVTTNNEYEVEIANVPLPPPPCPWDLNENNAVDFADILQVIANWGPCPTNP